METWPEQQRSTLLQTASCTCRDANANSMQSRRPPTATSPTAPFGWHSCCPPQAHLRQPLLAGRGIAAQLLKLLLSNLLQHRMELNNRRGWVRWVGVA